LDDEQQYEEVVATPHKEFTFEGPKCKSGNILSFF
jgi:hypothetical protein